VCLVWGNYVLHNNTILGGTTGYCWVLRQALYVLGVGFLLFISVGLLPPWVALLKWQILEERCYVRFLCLHDGRWVWDFGQGRMVPWLRSHAFECRPDELDSISSVTRTKLFQDDYFCGFGQGLVFADILYSQLQQILIRDEFCIPSVKASEKQVFCTVWTPQD